jgi:hypothetical protein
MKNLEKYNKVYEDCKKILGTEKHLDVMFNKTTKSEPSDAQMKEFNEYAKKFLSEDNNGMIRTILIIGKPYKNNPITKEVLSQLADILRKRTGKKYI